MRRRADEKSSSRAVLEIALTAVWTCALILGPRVSFGQAGSLDESFGTGGLVTTDFEGGPDNAVSVMVQTDGKIVVAGSTSQVFYSDFGAARYNTDGSLDLSFGIQGRVTTDFFGFHDGAHATAQQNDGKIVLAGSAHDPRPGGGNFALVRYNDDGSLDPTFGEEGRVTTDFTTGSPRFLTDYRREEAHSLVLQSDDKLIAAGFASVSQNSGILDFALARYLPDGSLDATFGAEGRVTTASNTIDIIHSMALQPDGKIVVAGETRCAGPVGCDRDFALARYLPDGSLDATFGSGGRLKTDFATDFGGFHDLAHSVALQADGKIIAAGVSRHPRNFGLAMARYLPDGSLDVTFGIQGRVVGTANGIGARSMALQTNGKIILAGWAYGGGFGLARYNSDGSLDATFGVDGVVTTDFSGVLDLVQSVDLQADGKIVVAGGTNVVTWNEDFALARYIGDAVPTSTISSIIEAIHDLVASGALNTGQGRALEATLETARNNVDRGNTTDAANQLTAFTRKVAAFIRGRILTASEGQPLIDAAEAIIRTLHEPSSRIAGDTEAHDAFLVGVETLPETYDLAQNYPNPFNPTTAIRVALPVAGHVQLVVYDLVGREVARLVDGPLPAGIHHLAWHAVNVPSGAYIYRLTSDDFTASKIMQLLK